MGKDHELLEAARIGNQNLLEKLLSPKAKSTTRTLAASIGIKVGPNVNCQDQSGYSPLHHAALNGHKDSVCFLLQNSASANVSDIKGNFPLHLASWSGNSEIVKCLLTYGPSIARVNEQNGDKETALHCAAQHGHTDTVKVLLKHAADPNFRNVRDESPLDLASQYGRLHVVRLILHFQPSLLSQSSERYTPLHLASRNGHKEVVEMLLAHGADINKTGENGSALHEAALFGKPEVVRLLLSRGANPHTHDPKNRTAMELVRQLNTQTSREISQLILSRLQDGEDYEPISPSPVDRTSTPSSLRRVQSQATVIESPHTYLDMQRGEALAFLERGYSSKNVFETPAPSLVSLPRVTVEDHYISPELRRASNTSSPHSTEGSKGFGGSWGRSSFGKGIILRRSASARSSRSLPRLPSSSGRSPSTSVLLSDPNHPASSALFRQHHPSSNMFPVSPASHLKPSDPARRASASLPSSPLLPSPLHSSPLPASQIKEEEENEEVEWRANKKIFTRERLKTEDDNVFLPGPTRKAKEARSRRVQSCEPHDSPAVNRNIEPTRKSEVRYSEELVDQASVEFGTPGRSPPGSRPKKPARARSKFSTPMTPMTPMTPPPIPPKPMSMMKVRPPSPVDPPPEDEEVDEEEEEMTSPDPEEGDQTEEEEENKENLDCSISHSNTAGYDAAAAIQKLRRSLVLPTGSNFKGRTSNRGSSSTDAQSPLFSPPSPHTAMIQISETLQKAISHENLIATSAANDAATLSDGTSHSVSSYHSTSTSSDSDDDVTSESMQKRRVTTSPGPPTKSESSNKQNMQANSDQKQSTEAAINDQSHAATSSKLISQNAVEKSPLEAPVPAKRNKPPVTNKPTVKKRLSLYEPNHAVVTHFQTPAVAPRKPTNLSDEPDDITVLDSQACYVTSGAVVKQARILSTRSSGSQPSSPMSLSYDKRQRDDATVLDESANPGRESQLAVVDTLFNAQTSILPAEGRAPTSGSPSNRVEPPRIENHPLRRQVEFVGTRNLSKGSIDSDDVGLDETKSTADEWDDSLSVRTEDLEMPKEVRKFRGLIRGASYRGRSKSRYGNSQKPTAQDDDQYVYDDSPYQSDSDSDCYGDKQEEHDINNEGRISESRATPALIRDHVPPPAKLAAAKPMMTLEGVAKRASPGSLDLVMSGARYPGNNAAMQGRRDLRRKRTPGRSDGDDSPLSSPTSSAEEFDARLAKDTSTPRLPKTREGSKLRLSQHIRQHSYYDNNNNSNSNGTKSPASSPERDPEVAGSNRLPDLDQIVDTVTAVRSRSQGNSSSDPASGSSASSTLAKPQASMSIPPPGANQQQGGAEVDENEEWAQIASIMSSIGGGLNKGPVYAKEFEETFWKIMTGSELPRQISTWLAELGLPQYEKVLCGNGFDDVDFLAGDILEEQDLVDMDIRDASHRRRLLESAQNLPRIHPLVAPDNDTAPSSVEEWLASLHLPQYEAAFVAAGFDTMQFVRLMGDLEIRPLVGKRGHYKRVKASLLSKSGEESKPTATRSARRTSSHGATRASPPLSRSPLLDSANFFKDYSNIVKSRAAATATATATGSSGTRSHDDDRSPAFHSGTVSSTGSGSSSVAADCHPHPLVTDTYQASVSRQPVRSQKSKEESAPRLPLPSDLPTSEQLVTSSASAHRSSSSSRQHGHRRRSSRDSEHTGKPRSRSGSHSSRTRRPELSVFVEKVPSSSSPASPPPHKEKSGRSSSHRHKSHHKSSSSIRSVDSERKETLRMSGKSTNVFDIPDIHRAIFLASEASPGGGAGGTGGLNLRPPNEATAEVSVHSWRHSAETLITTCCNYQAYYLGSMLVPELKGVESTVEACAKMRRSTDSMKKIPTIMLSINYTGVKFIDSKSKHEIAEHEICNISFASQDSEDLATFAYITHDVRTGHHYCHVFRVTTMDKAYEIILTLGQAFEVAYQLILKDKALKESESTT